MSRMYSRSLTALALAGVVACADEPVGPARIALEIVSITPTEVFVEGGELVQVETRNGCSVDALTVNVGDLTVASVQATSADVYTFRAPALKYVQVTEVPVKFTCKKAPEGTEYTPGKNVATTKLNYDPRLEEAPTLAAHGPVGDRVTVLGRMTVTFTREMNPASISAANLYIEGVESDVTYDAQTLTATVIPKTRLDFGKTYTCVVRGGLSGVVTRATGKPLRTTLANAAGVIDPLKDTWTFTTRREGDGDPLVGDVAAAAGVMKGGDYTLRGVTGQAGPVGAAADSATGYKLKAGFVYATDRAAGQ